MKNLFGCLLVLALLPVAAFVIYFIFNIILYFLPLLVVGVIVLSLPYLAYHFFKALKE